MHRPEPYYMMVPRITYFPIVLDRVVKYFNRFMEQGKNNSEDMWLDYDGQPIKWQHQIGLSWDLFGSAYDLPWRLILHFSDFPSKDLVRCNTKSSIKSIFMSSIKEADALKHKGSVTKNMLEKEQNNLWSSLVNDKFDQFWSINKRLMDKVDNELYKYVPFRLYFPDYTYTQKAIRPCTLEKQRFRCSNHANSTDTEESVEYGRTYAKDDIINNESFKCSHSSSEIETAKQANLPHRHSTMLDLLQHAFANRLGDLLIEVPRPNDDELTDKTGEELIDVRRFKYRFLTHGIEVPFDAPLQWLSEHLSYPDNFLHICAVIKNELV